MDLLKWPKSWGARRQARKLRQFQERELLAFSGASVLNVPGTGKHFSSSDFVNLDINRLQHLAAETLWSSPHAKGAMHQLSVLAMGVGLRLQALPNRLVLGLESAEAHELARTMEAYFSIIRSQNDCSHDGTRPYNGVELLGFWSWLIWDEVFTIQRYRDVNDVVPVSAEVIKPTRVKNPTTPVPNLRPGHTIKQGIEIDAAGKHVAFYAETISAAGSISYERIPYFARNGKRIGIHIFRAIDPDQVRGITRFMPIFHELKRMQEALQLETDTMAVNARLAAAFERNASVRNPDKLRDIAEAGGDLSVIGADIFTDNPGVSQRVSENGGIILQNLEPGEKLVPFDSKRPNVNVNEFILNVMTWLGPAIGIPIELWRALFGKAYSASKGSIDLGYKSFEQEITMFSWGTEQPYYEATIAALVGSGRLALPRWGDPLMRAAYLQTKWMGPPKPSLNPLQEEKAATERVVNWRSSNERETQLNSGTSFDVVADRKEYELERIDRVESGLNSEELLSA